MTKQEKLDLLVKIMTIFNNAFLVMSFLLALFIVPVGTICAVTIYFYIGLILAYTFRHTQNFLLTLFCWMPAMCFDKVTRWIAK